MARLRGTALALVLLAACSSSHSPCTSGPSTLVFSTAGGNPELQVDLAVTTEEHERGLAGRRSLGAGDGMAFLFDGDTSDAFWMKDTSIPLSIAFWDSSGRIVDTFDMTPCTAEPCTKYRSRAPYVGAVEANRGYFSRHGIGVGDRVDIRAPAC